MPIIVPTLKPLLEKYNKFYAKFEDFVIKDEPNEDVKLMKQILFFNIPLTIIYLLIIPLINPYIPFSRSLWTSLSIVSYVFMLRIKNFTLMFLFIICNISIVFLVGFTRPADLLRSIIIALLHPNQSMAFSRHKALSISFIVVNIYTVMRLQGNLTEIIDQYDFEEIKDAIRSLQYTWPLIYIMNTAFIMNLTNKYCKAFQESREAQKELQSKNQELFDLNNKLQSTLSLLETTNKELKAALNARELFIASVSHELRNPLNSMLGNIELLGLEINNPYWTKMLDTCKICGEVLLGLINNILDVAKINAEKLELNCQADNLHSLIEKMWVVSTIKMRQKGIKGHLFIGSNVPKYVEIDAHRLNQILLNLIGNATKFTKEGFVKVVVSWHKDGDIEALQGSGPEFKDLVNDKTLNQTLQSQSYLLDSSLHLASESLDQDTLLRTFRVRSLSQLGNVAKFDENDSKIQDKLTNKPQRNEEKGVLKIEVIDTGCGISSTSLHRLFQPFSQADASITTHFGGTGLGLFITKQLVQRMGGCTGVDSQQNIGSSFWMVIPTKKVEGAQGEEEEENVERNNGCCEKLRALVVDDDSLSQMIMTSYLRKLNIEADIANNGCEALQKFQENEVNYYCLITMDLGMPRMDGMSACKAIRKYESQSEAAKNVPIIVISTNCIACEKNECLDPLGEIKASYFFRKPFKFEECRSSVITLLNKNGNRLLTPDIKGSIRKVLIVDDDIFNRNILKDYLEKHNFECDLCVNGREAVAKVDERRYDVILMDCEMPEMDGYTAAKLIRGKHARLPIVGVTGNAKEYCLQKAREHGMNDVESKPVNFQNLRKDIERLICLYSYDKVLV